MNEHIERTLEDYEDIGLVGRARQSGSLNQNVRAGRF
jgi:hypothetical protein